MSEISDSVADVQGPEQPADRPRKPKLTRDERAAKNRANSLRSTGPRTHAGKATSSRNATTHGLTATTVAPDDAPGEPPGYYRKRLDLWIADVRPEGAVELALVEVACRASWRLDRVARFEAAGARRRHERRSDDPKAQCERARARQLGYFLMFTVGCDDYFDPIDHQSPNEYDDPPRYVDELSRFPEGLEWLIGEWEAVLKDLADLPDGGATPPKPWVAPKPGEPDFRPGQSLIVPPKPVAFAIRTWGRAVRLLGLPRPGGKSLPPPQALPEAGVAELARLRKRLVELAGEAGSRRESDLALFEPGPGLGLLMRYQTAATRDLFKAVELLAKLRKSPGVPNPGATEAVAEAEVAAPAGDGAPEPETKAPATAPAAAVARGGRNVRNEATFTEHSNTYSTVRDSKEGPSRAERAGR
jgi:hypothetical protein